MPQPIENLVFAVFNRASATPSGCWEWQGYRNAGGYGRVTHHQREQLAHRAAWEAINGPIPVGMMVCHRCDNPPCVNPDHLFLGTNADNISDMWAKGRHPENLGNAKLDEAGVRSIRAALSDGLTHRAVAAAHGVSHHAVGAIARGTAWRKVA